jgi:hypothetical protein
MVISGAGRYAMLRLSDPRSLSRIASRDASLSAVTHDITMARNKVRVLRGKPPTRRRRATIRALN